MRAQFASATCSTCNTDFDRIPVNYNEDGTGYVAIPQQPCADPNCATVLCPCCAQFHCDGCGETFCADHLVSVPDGTDRPLHCCRACADEAAQQELPLVAAAHECIEHLTPLTICATETHGLEYGPYERTEETRWSCSVCGATYAEAEAAELHAATMPVRIEAMSERPAAGAAFPASA